MSTLKFFTVTLALTLVCSAVHAQLGRRIQNAARNAAENAVVRQTERRTEDAVNKAIDDAFDPNKNSGNNNSNNNQQQQGNGSTGSTDSPTGNAGSTGGAAQQNGAQQGGQQGGNALEMAYARNDFVPGDEIFFEDLMDNEQLGEFPSMWDLKAGSAVIATINGKKAIYREDREKGDYRIAPLMKDMKNYLPEKYTIEMDLWMAKKAGRSEGEQAPTRYSYELYFFDANNRQVAKLEINNHGNDYMGWNYTSTSDETVNGNGAISTGYDGWHHLSISFNQRAFKAYIDGVRIANIPNMKQAANFQLRDRNINSASWAGAITNVRLAKGAVPLYDRMLTDGKFITYGITFDVGKSTIKPESMGEINRIVQLMKENPALKFSVEGHTDSTGNQASNQTLSEARSQAVVDKLVENGIARDHLSAAGKGQTAPIADNGTDEGRAKNRRVEFVKM